MLRRAKKLTVALSVLAGLFAACDKSFAVNELKVMSFNTWSVEDTATGRDAIVEIVKKSGADVVGFQELDHASEIAGALGWYSQELPKSSTHVMSRYQIVSASTNGFGAKLALPGGVNAWVYDTHLPAYPYQPYDLRDNKVAKNEAAVISAANSARGSQMAEILADIAATGKEATELVFLTGDFNEPSCLDWTQAVADSTARSYDIKVDWPASRSVLNAGLKDSFRTVRPDAVNDHGYSWTPRPAANEVFDRIDFVYYDGQEISVKKVENIGIDASKADTDIAIAGYPSDHRAVLATFEYSEAGVDAGKNILTSMDVLAGQGALEVQGTVNYGDEAVTVTGWQAFEMSAQGELTASSDIVFADSSELVCGVTVNKAGNYVLRLTVDVDGEAVSDDMELVVFEDSCKAAKAVGSWQADQYDVNGDCIVNVSDFALYSDKWLSSTALSESRYFTSSYYSKSSVIAGATGLATNAAIPADHGSNMANTPHISLAWSPTGGSNNANNQWESYSSWPGGGDGGLVYQMGSVPVDEYKSFEIVFTPEAGYNVQLACLSLNVWSGGGNTDVNWTVSGATSGELGSGVFNTPDGAVREHEINVSGVSSEALTLTLTQTSGDGTYLAMDDLVFGEIELVE